MIHLMFRRGRGGDVGPEESSREQSEEEELSAKNNQKLTEVFNLTEERKNFLMSKIVVVSFQTGTTNKVRMLLS